MKQSRSTLEGVNATIRKETAYFLKQLIKQFEMHSRGIEWMVRLLISLKENITRNDLPEDLTTEDRKFIEELFASEKAEKTNHMAGKRPTNMSLNERVKSRPKSRNSIGL